jgi:hypothetical protein
MNVRLRVLKPIPLTFIFILLSLVSQAVWLSSTSSTFVLGSDAPTPTVHSFGLGSPISIISINGQTTLKIQWAMLLLNLTGTYVLSALLAWAIARATGLRSPAAAYGLVALSMIAFAFVTSITISKFYWGYFFTKPGLLSETSQVTEVRAVASIKTVEQSGKRFLVADETDSLPDSLASAKKYAEDCLDGRILLELDRRKLIPPAFIGSLAGLSEFYRLIEESNALVASSPGYDSSQQLEGVVVDAIGSQGNRLVFLCLTGGQLSNDHYPYYELLFRGEPESNQLSLIRAQRYFYDAAGMEGFEWYVIWPMLAIPGVLVAFLLFTIVKTLPKTPKESDQHERP